MTQHVPDKEVKQRILTTIHSQITWKLLQWLTVTFKKHSIENKRTHILHHKDALDCIQNKIGDVFVSLLQL